MKSFFLLLFFIVLIRPQQKNKEIPKQSSEEFPNQVGDHWTYRLITGDENNKVKSYINVDIIDQMKLPNGKIARIWVYKFPEGVDTNYVVSDSGMVRVYNAYFNYCNPCNGIMPQEKIRYSYPLAEGKHWTLDEKFGDTIKVIGRSYFKINNRTYSSYTIIRLRNNSVSIGNYINQDTITLTMNIGLTRFKQMEINSGSMYGN